MFTCELVLIGLVIGIFTGMSGVGGGSIMTPVMILFLGINPLVAVGTDLFYSIPTKIVGALIHTQQRTVDWGIVRCLLLGGIPGVLLGTVLLYTLRNDTNALMFTLLVKRGVGVALFASAAAVAYSTIARRNLDASTEIQRTSSQRRTWPLVACGAVVGFFVVLTSIGSGAMLMPLLLLIAPIVGIPRLVGSDIAYAAFLIPSAALGHAALGDVNYDIALSLLIGSLPGVFIGSRLCKTLPDMYLRPALAMILVVAGSRLL